MKIEYRDPKTLIPHPKNRNVHPETQIEKLEKLIKTFGFKVPILVSKNSGYIVSGHARHSVALRLNLDSVPIIILDFDSDEKEYAFLVNDNLIHEFSFLDKNAIAGDILECEFDESLFCDVFNQKDSFIEEDFSDLELDEPQQKTINTYSIEFVFASHEERKEFFEKYVEKIFPMDNPEKRKWVYHV